MLMWYIILAIVILMTGGGLLYVSTRLPKFGAIGALRRNGKDISRRMSVLLVVVLFALLALTLNLMNAVVCLVHFAVIWWFCELIFGLIKRVYGANFKHYYAGWCAIVLSLATLWVGWHLDHHVDATSYTLHSGKNSSALRVVQFADSHIGTTFDADGFAVHLQKMQQYNPDVLLIVGDFVDDDTSRADMLAACEALGQFKAKHGVYFVFGNHDKGYHDPSGRGFSGDDLIKALRQNGVHVLQDEAELVAGDFYILGRQDLSEFQRGGNRADMQTLVKPLDKSKFIMVLDHQPNDYGNQTQVGVDLVLSGHTHGGQFFPLNKVGEWIGVNDQTYGFARRGLTDFIVTSGLSDWAIRFKTGTTSEFVVIDIQ